jgi:hypothetical protein
MVNRLAMTCKFHVWHSWEGPETATGAYGIWCKSAHTVHVVDNFNFNFNSRGKDISDWPSGRSMCQCTDIVFFQNPPYKASPQLLIPRIAATGTSFSPLPCQAWHGYWVTSAHRVDVEVGADGLASAPLSGAAAAAPPAGAVVGDVYVRFAA